MDQNRVVLDIDRLNILEELQRRRVIIEFLQKILPRYPLEQPPRNGRVVRQNL